MRKILFIYVLMLATCFLTACSDDDNNAPTLSFGRPIYILKAAAPLAVEVISSVPVTESVRVPFDISGSAILDEDYTIETDAFTLEPGKTIDTIWITPKENVTTRREIRLALKEVNGFQLWNNRVAMIPVETKDVFSCSFEDSKYDLKNEVIVKMGLMVNGKMYYTRNDEVRVPFEIDPASTAVLGEHYEIVGGKQELVMVGNYKSTADVTLRFLKNEEGKDKVIFRMQEGGLFERGNNAATTITVSGPTTFKALVGKWAFSEITSESFIRRMAGYVDPNDCDNLPLDNRSTDVIQFIAGASNTLNVDQVQGDLLKYLRNCEAEFGEEGPWRLYEQTGMPSRDVITLYLSKANVNYSATSIDERRVFVGVRLLNKNTTLELRIVDYEPTDFLTRSYYAQLHPGWGEPDEFPMKDLYPLVFHFTKVEE